VPDDVTATPDPVAAVLLPDAVVPEATVPDDVVPEVAVPEVAEPAAPRVLTYVGLLAGGLVLGFFGTVLASVRTITHGHTIWWGVGLVLLATLTCVRGAAWLVGSRRGAALIGLGWVLPTLAFTTTNPGGDVLLPDDTRTYVYLVGATVVIVLATALPLPRGARALAAEQRARRGHRDESLEPAATDDASPGSSARAGSRR